MNHIRYVEYDAMHKESFVFDVPEGHDCWLLIITQTPAIFYVDNEYRKYPPNSAVLYKPSQKIYYRACENQYVNDWIRFDTDENYIANSPLPTGIPFPIQDHAYCHKIYQLIAMEHILNNTYKDISIDYFMRIMFNKLLESYDYKHISSLHKQLYKLKQDIYRNSNKDWTVKKMSEMLNVSVGYLEDIYKKTFGVTCIEDVINSRINQAKEYLLYHHYTINEVIELCGYRNTEHFYRQFKKVTGITPTQFRNSKLKIEQSDRSKKVINGQIDEKI